MVDEVLFNSEVSPLAHNVPIVDPETGNPTPYFMRIISTWLKEKKITEDQLFGLGIDGLSDVDTVSDPPEDGEGLVWYEDLGWWAPGVVTAAGATFKGCYLYKTSDQAIAAGGGSVTITFDAERFDTHGFHSTSSNTDRITMLNSGYAVVTGNLGTSSQTDQIVLRIEHYNSSDVSQGVWIQDTDTTGGDFCSVTSGPVAVSAGDYFRMVAQSANARNSTSGATGTTSFSMFMLAEPATTTPGLVLIDKKVATGSENSFTFSSIPQTYTDLILVVSGRSTSTSAQVFVTVNGLGTGIYDRQRLFAENTTVTAAESLAQNSWSTIFGVARSGDTAGFTTGGEMTIYGYAQTSLHKAMTAIARHINSASSGNGYIISSSGVVRTTNAITSLTVALTAANNFATGSFVALYGRS